MGSCRLCLWGEDADCLRDRRTPLPFLPRLTRAALYGAQVFLSFFLMLVFMTYNVRPVEPLF